MYLTRKVAHPRIPQLALALLGVSFPAALGQAQQVATRGPASANAQPTSGAMPAANGLRPIFQSRPGEHPLMPGLRWADLGVKRLESVHDYACTFVKRERIEGELSPYIYMRLKVRHQPFSVYVYFDAPADKCGQEAIYVEGRNDGKLLAHGVGLKAIAGTLALDPTSPRAMAGCRHPITSIGILNMTQMLRDVAAYETQFGECEVRYLPGTRVSGRYCTCMQMVHPVPRREFKYHMARIFVDDEIDLPIRFETYDWPSRPGESPVLNGEYTFLNLKVNNGFTDMDFDVRNPRYGFR